MTPIDQLARECGATPYVNRHAPGETAIAFGPQAWAKFCERVAAPVAQQPQAEAAQKSEASSVRDADDVPTERAVLVREWKALRLALSSPRPTRSDSLPGAMGVVIKAMRSDPEYAWGWHCNIAMAFVDAGGDHYTANQGAARFISALAGVGPAHELPAAPQQAEAVPSDRVLVPVEPTEEMQYAGGAALGGMPSHLQDAGTAYRAMIDAAIAQQKGGV